MLQVAGAYQGLNVVLQIQMLNLITKLLLNYIVKNYFYEIFEEIDYVNIYLKIS